MGPGHLERPFHLVLFQADHVPFLDGANNIKTLRQRLSKAPPTMIILPKNRSTGNLFASNRQNLENLPSFDTGNVMDFDSAVLSPVLSEHEHGLGVTGLRRIRQQPHSRAPSSQPLSPNSSFSLPPRSASMTLSGSTGRTFAPGAAPSSPTLNLGEDLSRFPSESLHSFSFNHQSEDILHNRQNLLKKSIEFLHEKLDWASNNPGLVAAQAKVSGDVDVQNMMELLVKANILGDDDLVAQKFQAGTGALTGPADLHGSNIFEKVFMQSSGPGDITLSAEPDSDVKDESDLPSPFSSQAEPSLNSSASAVDLKEPLSPPDIPPRVGLKRTNTDISLLTLQTKLADVLARPYAVKGSNDNFLLSPAPVSIFTKPANSGANAHSTVHGHSNRWVPAPQVIFTTEAQAPWTILAANDLACLVFGVTKAEVKSLGILEVVREDRRSWLEERLRSPGVGESVKSRRATSKGIRITPTSPTTLGMGGGVTAHLLSKPSSRQLASQKRSQTVGTGNPNCKKKSSKHGPHHIANKSRGVLLCGDVVPIVKRNGNTGSASLWVKEKRGGLIWVLEEITEDSASLDLDEDGYIVSARGASDVFCVETPIASRKHIKRVIPKLPACAPPTESSLNFELINEVQYYAARNCDGEYIPTSVTADASSRTISISSFPHIAGIIVLSSETLEITSSNSVFSAALFGRSDPDGLNITELIPQFDKMLESLLLEKEAVLTDGVVIPEHSFRRARALLALKDSSADAATVFSRPAGLVARHRDGSDINIDIQMRVVRSDTRKLDDSVIDEKSEDLSESAREVIDKSEVVLALWITYSRQLHSSIHPRNSSFPAEIKAVTPRQPSPGQKKRTASFQMDVDDTPQTKRAGSHISSLSQQIREAASQPISDSPPQPQVIESLRALTKIKPREIPKKKEITDFTILEEMGQGAYGQVKLANHSSTGKKVVLKYVTKHRILVDTWTRDRRLGTVPLEIHVLDYLRKDGFRHPNIVEMTDFFEDEKNYYIEMVPHGPPGMDLFDYIEMRSKMDEAECRNIFLQVVAALHHLHTKALVVHRDIKDENIILDGENRVKLIDFGSAAYIKNGPFNVFVGTIGKGFTTLHILTFKNQKLAG